MKAIHYGILLLILSLLAGCLESSRAAPTHIAEKYSDKVVLYSTSWCGYCRKTRELFKNNYIDYIEIDIETSNEGRSEFDELRGKGIPLVLIKGRVVDGYAPKAFLKLANGT